MAMAFQALGVPSVSLNAFQVSMQSTSKYGNARFKRIDTDRINHELENRKIVVVTGFQGINKYDDYTTLGRGGSDTTAVALAAVLHADVCEIYTDVDGVYTADPRVVKMRRSWMKLHTMRCWSWHPWEREFFITDLSRWQKNTEYSLWYVLVLQMKKERQ